MALPLPQRVLKLSRGTKTPQRPTRRRLKGHISLRGESMTKSGKKESNQRPRSIATLITHHLRPCRRLARGRRILIRKASPGKELQISASESTS